MLFMSSLTDLTVPWCALHPPSEQGMHSSEMNSNAGCALIGTRAPSSSGCSTTAVFLQSTCAIYARDTATL